MITSACFSPLFNRVIGLGFVKFGQASDVIVDPELEFSTLNFARFHPTTRIKQSLERHGSPTQGENYHPIKRSSLTVFHSPA